MNEKANFTAQELALEMANDIGSLGVLLEDFKHARNLLGQIALDAKDKYSGDKQMWFLLDTNDTLQTVDNLMFRLLKEIDEEYKKIDEMQGQLRELLSFETKKPSLADGNQNEGKK